MQLYSYNNMVICNYDNMQISYLWIMFDEFLSNQVLFRLDFFEERKYMPDLGQDDLIVIFLAQFMAYGEFIGPFH